MTGGRDTSDSTGVSRSLDGSDHKSDAALNDHFTVSLEDRVRFSRFDTCEG